MKTFAHINAAGGVVGIGMIYLESGSFTEPVADQVAALGEDAGIKAYGDSVRQDPALTTIVIDTAQMPGGSAMGYDKMFRGAFRHGGGLKVAVDMPTARLIAHDARRKKRAAEMAPLDIQASIPAQATAAEAARQKIRDKYAVIQTQIDGALDDLALKNLVTAMLARP